MSSSFLYLKHYIISTQRNDSNTVSFEHLSKQMMFVRIIWIPSWPLSCKIGDTVQLAFNPFCPKFLFLFLLSLLFRFAFAKSPAGWPLALTLSPPPQPHSHTHAHARTNTHKTKPKRWFPPLSVLLAFLSVHEAPQEMAFIQKCAPTSSAHVQNINAQSIVVQQHTTRTLNDLQSTNTMFYRIHLVSQFWLWKLLVFHSQFKSLSVW